MRNHLLVALFVVVSGFIAEDARACKQCAIAYPYGFKCNSTICGVSFCTTMVTSDGYFCISAYSCAENAQYCGSLEREPEQLWACSAPATHNWTLVAVKIKRNAGKAA
jgi:hypothetical protein